MEEGDRGYVKLGDGFATGNRTRTKCHVSLVRRNVCTSGGPFVVLVVKITYGFVFNVITQYGQAGYQQLLRGMHRSLETLTTERGGSYGEAWQYVCGWSSAAFARISCTTYSAKTIAVVRTKCTCRCFAVEIGWKNMRQKSRK